MPPHLLPMSLRPALWNADGLFQKRYKLEDFANRNELDVILVSETYPRPNHNRRMPNYQLYRRDCEGILGGTAIYVRRNIDHSADDPYDLSFLEANSIVITLAETTQIRVAAAYCRPGSPLLAERSG